MELINPRSHLKDQSLPADWPLGSIGDNTSKVGSGITPTGGSKVYKESGRPFVRSQNVGWGVLDLSDVAHIDDATHSAFDSTEIRLGDVLLNITGASIGRSAVAEDRIVGGNVNQHVCIIRPIQTKLVPEYLNFFILSESGQRQIADFQAGGNRQGINFSQIRSIQLPLPPLSEQRAIVEVLGDVDALIAALDRLIAKKRAIKQGVMQQLLSGKRRLTGFSNVWVKVRLSEFLVQKPTYGIVKAGYFVNDGIPMVRGGDIKDGNISLDLPMVSQVKSDEYERTKLQENDVLIALVGYPGEAAKVLPSLVGANISRAVGLLRVSKFMDPDYLVSFLNSPMGRKLVLAPSVGSAQLVVNLKDLNNLSFYMPSLAEQQAIVKILQDFKAELVDLEKKYEKVIMLKNALIQELLTGRTRLR